MVVMQRRRRNWVCTLTNGLALALALLLGLGIGLMTVWYTTGQAKAAGFYDDRGLLEDDGARLTLPAVKSVRITPVVEYYAADGQSLLTEVGLSYLIEAGDSSVLMDLGDMHDKDPAAETPLIHNMKSLGIQPGSLDAILISHPHGDHMGGINRTRYGLADVPVYVTMPDRQPEGRNVPVPAPQEIVKGIGTTGPIPVGLLTGMVEEQALVVNVEGKGLLLVLGCGHPRIDVMVDRAESVYGGKVFAVVGGLHLPVTADRSGLNWLRPQNLLGRPKPFSRPVREADVERTIAYLKGHGVELVAVSPHGSCDWTLAQFAEAFGSGYRPVKVGEAIMVE